MSLKKRQRICCKNFEACGRSYVRRHALTKHEETCEKRPHGRAKIAGGVQKAVWEKYIGRGRTTATCTCCHQRTISVFSNANHFQCGHILSDKHGGKAILNNLLPICQYCNNAMGAMHFDAYVEKHNYPLRTRGKYPPEKVLAAVCVLQRFIRNVPRFTKQRRMKKITLWAEAAVKRLKHHLLQPIY
jgi:5-methylcytosine-specific restriction endonuclease McrA